MARQWGQTPVSFPSERCALGWGYQNLARFDCPWFGPLAGTFSALRHIPEQSALSASTSVVEDPMHPMVWLGIVVLVLWAFLWLGFKIVSGVIHILVVVGVVLLIWGLIKRGANAVRSRM
jgi:hypothetical protein